MKREYVIGGVFFILFLAFMIGVTILGGKQAPVSKVAVAPTPTPSLNATPTPTAVPFFFDEEIEIATEPISEESVLLTTEPTAAVDPVDESCWIAGYCKGEDGTVLPGVQLKVYFEPESNGEMQWYLGEPDAQYEAATDENGYYTIPLEGLGKYRIHAIPQSNYLSLRDDFQLTPQKRNLAKHFEHPLAPFSVRGKVVDVNDKSPIANAKVQLFPRSIDNHAEQICEEATTGADGSFVVRRIAKGTFFFTASAEGYVDFRPFGGDANPGDPLRNVQVNHSTQNKEYTIEMYPGGRAIVRVEDANGQGIEGALVIVKNNASEYNFSESETTDSSGDANCSKLNFQRLIAQAQHKKYGVGFSKPFQPGSQDNPTRVTVVLDGSAQVSGTVTDSKGSPVPEREIVATYLSVDDWVRFPEYRVKTGPQGTYSFNQLTAGTYRIAFSGHASRSILYQRKQVELQAGDRKIVNFQVGETRELRGKVVTKTDMEPVEEASVYSVVYLKNNIEGTERATTDANGEFVIPYAPLGDEIQFQINKQGYSLTIHHREMDGSYYTLTIDEAGAVRGVVLSPENQPITGANVCPISCFSFDDSRNTNQTVLSNNDGSFEFTDLYPMDYRFRASMDGYLDSESAQFTLHQGESVENVIIQMKEGDAISGVVLDPQGQPVPQATVSIYSYIPNIARNSWSSHFSAPEYPANAITNADGTFEIENFPPEGDELIVTHESFAPARKKVIPNPEEPQVHTIVMSQGGSIVGTVLDKQNQPMKTVELHSQNFPENLCRYQAFTDENGDYRMDRLPAVPFQVLKPMNDGVVPADEYKTVTVVEGREVRCDFGGGEGSTVYGTVFKGDEPYPNVAVALDGTSFNDYENEGIGNYFMTVTDEGGNYSISSVPEGHYKLIASTKVVGGIHEHSSDYTSDLFITDDKNEYLQDIFLGIFNITGTVVDADTQQPLNNVSIKPSASAGFPATSQLSTKTGEDGVFTIRPQDPGTYELSAVKDGYETKDFQVSIEPDGTSTTYTVTVEMNLIQDDMILIAHLVFDGEAASCSWAHFHSKPQGFSGMLVSSNLPEPGGYRVTGMPEGQIEVSVAAYCYGRMRSSLPHQVFMQKDRVTEITMNIFETQYFMFFLKTPNDAPIGDSPIYMEIDLPGETYKREIHITKNMQQTEGNLFYAELPVGRHLVRISTPGYQPIEFYPEDVAQPGPNENQKKILLNLVKN